jgi:hypothetical protein
MLEQFTQLTGVICMMTRRTFKFLGSVERFCRFTLADYFSARPDNFLIAIDHVALNRVQPDLRRALRLDLAGPRLVVLSGLKRPLDPAGRLRTTPGFDIVAATTAGLSVSLAMP